MKPMCELFADMLATGNGIIDRFMLIVPDCRKTDPDERESAQRRSESVGITVSDIYKVVAKSDASSDHDFYFSDDSLM